MHHCADTSLWSGFNADGTCTDTPPFAYSLSQRATPAGSLGLWFRAEGGWGSSSGPAYRTLMTVRHGPLAGI